MGAAAFLIAEFTGISYTDILKHALVPALVSYIALVYIVHLEALKMNLKGLPKPPSNKSFSAKMIGFLSGFIGIAVLGLIVYYGTWLDQGCRSGLCLYRCRHRLFRGLYLPAVDRLQAA